MKKICCFIIVLICLCGCTKTSKNPAPQQSIEQTIDNMMQSMTLRQKVGMLFAIRPESLDDGLTLEQINDTFEYGVTKVSDRMRKTYRDYPAGGFVIFLKNIANKSQLKKFNKDLHSLGNVMLYVDEEGGKVARLANAPNLNLPKYQSAAETAQTDNTSDVYEMGKSIGRYLREFDFNADFAPVADVNSNPNNPIIGTRAFSSNPATAAIMCRAYSDGLRSQNILNVYKHFPGHGDTSTDTHLGYAEINKTWDEMLGCELVTFQDGIKNNVPMIMIAHICLPNVTGDKTPASLSKTIIQDKLQNELGYKGVIVTDALSMGAITQVGTSDKVAVEALKAGNDILLMPYDYKLAFDAIAGAVESGELTMERLDQSVKKILLLKKVTIK